MEVDKMGHTLEVREEAEGNLRHYLDRKLVPHHTCLEFMVRTPGYEGQWVSGVYEWSSKADEWPTMIIWIEPDYDASVSHRMSHAVPLSPKALLRWSRQSSCL